MAADTFMGPACKTGPHNGTGCIRYSSTRTCVEAERARQAAYDATHKDEKAAYQAAHKDKIAAYQAAHKDEIAKRQAAYAAAHKDKIAKYYADYKAERYRTDPQYRLNQCVSNAIRDSLKGNKAGRKWETLVGYTIKDLQDHLEPQFTSPDYKDSYSQRNNIHRAPGMTWDNYGSEWHIDHIKPQAHHIFETAEDPQFKECWALDNLQPMWGPDNLNKNDNL